MKKGKKDRKIIQKVRVKNKDNELEMKEHLHSILDKKIIDKKAKWYNFILYLNVFLFFPGHF